MESLPSPVAAFAARLRTDPEEPWLFHQRGDAWRWLSTREAAARAEAMAASLTSLSRGSRVAFGGDLSPTALVLDLALQAAGLTAVPVAGTSEARDLRRALAERGADAWACRPEDAPPALPERIRLIALPSTRLAGGVAAAAPTGPRQEAAAEREPPDAVHGELGGEGAEPAPGGAVVAGPEGPSWLSGQRLEEAAQSLAAELGPGRRRDVTVLGAPLEEPLARLHLAWATLTGAALVLEPQRAALPATAVWARPTVLAGTAPELLRHRAAWEASLPRRRRGDRRARPLGRLRAWLLPASDPPEPAQRRWWEHRRVVLVPVELV